MSRQTSREQNFRTFFFYRTLPKGSTSICSRALSSLIGTLKLPNPTHDIKAAAYPSQEAATGFIRTRYFNLLVGEGEKYGSGQNSKLKTDTTSGKRKKHDRNRVRRVS